jgi:hypothetical protein
VRPIPPNPPPPRSFLFLPLISLKGTENFRYVRYTTLLREHAAKVQQANLVFQRVATVFENVSRREGQCHPMVWLTSEIEWDGWQGTGFEGGFYL